MGKKKKHSHYLSSICLTETWIPFFFSSTLVMTFSRMILWFCRASSRCLNLWKKGKFSPHRGFPRSWVNRGEQGGFLWGQWAWVKSVETTQLSLLWFLSSDQPAAAAGKHRWEVLNPAELHQQWGTCGPCALPGGSCGRWGCRRSHKTPSVAPGGAPGRTRRTPLLHLQLLRKAKQGCHWQGGELRKRVTKLTISCKVSTGFF